MGLEPVIKWSGSKRSQAFNIISYFPKIIDTYYEPFCGGASVFRRLVNSNISVKNYVLSDINEDLINLWNEIKYHPQNVCEHYKNLWNELNKDSDIERKKDYFYCIRERYNKERNPLDFMFIMRTTTNGMPRYNKNGDFNNSFHFSRDGIKPEILSNIIYDWSNILTRNDVTCISCSYNSIIPNSLDYMYFDPPYFNTKGMYYGTIEYDEFWNYLRQLSCPYSFSFDGISGDDNRTVNVPTDVYKSHVYLSGGKSSFKRLNKHDEIVYESLYLR